MEKLATVIIALGAIATLLTVILKRVWPSESEQVKSIKAQMRENRYAIMQELNSKPDVNRVRDLIAERERLSEELHAASAN